MKLLPTRRVILLCASALFVAAAGDVGAAGPRAVRTAAPRNPLQIAVVPATPPPTAAELAAFAGPNPAGLQSQFPAGLPQPGQPTPPTFGAVGQPVIGFVGRGVGVTTAAAYGGIAVGAADTLPVYAGNGHPGPYSAVEIAKSFIEADTDRDGTLTPAEAQHLAIMPKSFEGMDTNHDGLVSRWEYEDAFK